MKKLANLKGVKVLNRLAQKSVYGGNCAPAPEVGPCVVQSFYEGCPIYLCQGEEPDH